MSSSFFFTVTNCALSKISVVAYELVHAKNRLFFHTDLVLRVALVLTLHRLTSISLYNNDLKSPASAQQQPQQRLMAHNDDGVGS